MRRALFYTTSVSVVLAVCAVQCGGKPTIIQNEEQTGGSGGRTSATDDASAGGFIDFGTGGDDAGPCNPDAGTCGDAGRDTNRVAATVA